MTEVLSEPPTAVLCFLCNKILLENDHHHSASSIPKEDLQILLNHFGKLLPKKIRQKFICCSHFKEHPLCFRFRGKNYPGLAMTEVNPNSFFCCSTYSKEIRILRAPSFHLHASLQLTGNISQFVKGKESMKNQSVNVIWLRRNLHFFEREWQN